MDLDSLYSCSICMDTYDSSVRPRCLPCGHSFCTTCIANFIRFRRLLCPQCQTPHRASMGKDFPINHSLETIISELRKTKLDAMPNEQPGRTIHPSQPGSKWKAVFNAEKESLIKLIEDCKEIQLEMLDYHAFLDQRTTEHEEFLPKIQEWLEYNEDVIGQIAAEKKYLLDMVKEADELETQASDTLGKLGAVSSIKDIINGSEEIGRSSEILEEWRIRGRNLLPNAALIRSSEELVRKTTAALCLLNTQDNDARKIAEEDIAAFPIMRKVDIFRGRDKISVGELQNMSPDISSYIERGLLFALQTKDGRSRYAKLSLRNDMVYLHHLQDMKVPEYPITVQHEKLIDALKTDSIVAFMDLTWEGSVRGRVHILLSPDTPLARHFKILCSGELGPSYANSTFLDVWNKECLAECVFGGDYDRGDGTGGAALITGLNARDSIYTRSCDEGYVSARFNDKTGKTSAQFAINTRSRPDSASSQVFGQVQDGLHIVKAAVKLDDVQKVKVEDCGLVLHF